jgi:hypothetical protein
MGYGNCFDEEEDAPLHGECTAEINRLNTETGLMRTLLKRVYHTLANLDESEKVEGKAVENLLFLIEQTVDIAADEDTSPHDEHAAKIEQMNEELTRVCTALKSHSSAIEKSVISEAVAAEREACALTCDALAYCPENTEGYRGGAKWCAEAIRARGSK